MLKQNEKGFLGGLVLPLVFFATMAIGLGLFGIWSYTQYTTQRDDVDLISAKAVEAAEAKLTEELDAAHQEELKNPYKTFVSSAALGSVKITYPKTWGAYVSQQDSGSVKLEGYFHPDYVPSPDSGQKYAVRLSLDDDSFTKQLGAFQDLVDEGSITATAITVSGTEGIRLDGAIGKTTEGAIVLLPLRDRTLKIWTEAPTYLNDFNDIVIKNLSYSP